MRRRVPRPQGRLMKRPVRFELRMSTTEHRALLVAAKRAKRSLSDWARIELARAAEVKPDADDEQGARR